MESAKALPAPNSPRPASPVVFKNSLLRFIGCAFLGLLPLVTKKSKKVPTANPKKKGSYSFSGRSEVRIFSKLISESFSRVPFSYKYCMESKGVSLFEAFKLM